MQARPARPPIWTLPATPQPWTQPATARRAARRGRGVVPFVLGGTLGAALAVALTVAAMFVFGPQPAMLPAGATTGSVSLTMNDAFLTSEANQQLSHMQLPVSVSDLEAHVAAGNTIKISGSASWLIFASPLRATAQVGITPSGQLTTHLSHAQIGGAPLPAAAASAIQSALNQQLNAATTSMATSANMAVTGVHTTPGVMTIYLGAR